MRGKWAGPTATKDDSPGKLLSLLADSLVIIEEYGTVRLPVLKIGLMG